VANLHTVGRTSLPLFPQTPIAPPHTHSNKDVIEIGGRLGRERAFAMEKIRYNSEFSLICRVCKIATDNQNLN